MAFIQQCVFSWSLFVRPIPPRNGAVDRHALKNFRARGALSNVEMLFVSASCKSIRNCKHVPVIYKYNFAGRVRPCISQEGGSARIFDSIESTSFCFPAFLSPLDELKCVMTTFLTPSPLCCYLENSPLCCYLENVKKYWGNAPNYWNYHQNIDPKYFFPLPG